jgi:hypothetical protein
MAKNLMITEDLKAARENTQFNSAHYWLPLIVKAGLPIPYTIGVGYDHGAFGMAIEGRPNKGSKRTVSLVGEACSKIGYPCFIRTDLGSAKHTGPKAYLVREEKEIRSVLSWLIQDQEIKFWLTGLPSIILVRQFLDLDSSFCAFGGLPISREWRFFANPRGLICGHPYWPEGALTFMDKKPRGWKKILKAHHKPPTCWKELVGMAIKAATACKRDAWSIDFAMDKQGKWWLIDMALMEDSWHWPGCPTSKDVDSDKPESAPPKRSD